MDTVRAFTDRAILDIDWGSQGEDIEGERMGGKPAEAHILWYVCKAVAGLSSCLGMGFFAKVEDDQEPTNEIYHYRQDFTRWQYR